MPAMMPFREASQQRLVYGVLIEVLLCAVVGCLSYTIGHVNECVKL